MKKKYFCRNNALKIREKIEYLAYLAGNGEQMFWIAWDNFDCYGKIAPAMYIKQSSVYAFARKN